MRIHHIIEVFDGYLRLERADIPALERDRHGESIFLCPHVAAQDLGDEYRDYDLVFASTQGTPTEANFIDRAFTKLIADNHLPKVVFHSLRHTSTTYKLKLSGGDIKAVQGDTGHAQATMVTERYAHILDDDRRVNATRFQKEFYGSGEPETAAGEASEVQRASTDLLQSLDAAAKQQLLLKLLAESPDMATLLTALTGKGA